MRVQFIENGKVVNTVEQETLDNPFGYLAVASEIGGPGWDYVDGVFVMPPEPEIVPVPEPTKSELLAQVNALMAQIQALP